MALLVANARAVEIVTKMSTDEVIDLANKEWFSDRAAQRPYVENILYRTRGWSWITEGDARSLIEMSKVKTIFQAELDPAKVKATLAVGAAMSREAWEKTGMKPDAAAFKDSKAPDTRGTPIWEIENWKL